VAYLVNRADLGLEYSSYKDSKNIEQDVASLMSGGRYVVSVVRTREGILVLHHTNTEAVEQHFAVVEAGELKSECSEQFDSGYAVTYYNKDGGFAIFDKDPTVTKQEVVGKLDQKSLKKFNDKGMYVVAGSNEAYVLQERHDGIVRQTIESHPSMYRLQCDSFFTMVDHNYVPAFLTKSYNFSDDTTAYTVVYSEYDRSYADKQTVKEFRSEEQLTDYLKSQQFRYGYRLCCLWGGLAE
jgi:hypothetical protein